LAAFTLLLPFRIVIQKQKTMKKIKIMLTAVAVFAVVGGALAFKAEKFVTLYLYTKLNGTCPGRLFDPWTNGVSIQFPKATTDPKSAAANICELPYTVQAE
jgi:prolipoprotein diacylglyceryltransferase